MKIKKKIALWLLCCCAFGQTAAQDREDISLNDKQSFISHLLEQMTLDEKIGQLHQCSGRGNFTGPDTLHLPLEEYVRQGKVGTMLNIIGIKEIRKYQSLALQSRLHIPLIFGLDIIHGYRTGFPIPLAEAASFDLAMMEEAARCNALEGAADGQNWTFAPMVDISWDARWGRVMEGAGEDPYLGSKVAEARVKGLQGEQLGDTCSMMACVKHFAGYGAPMSGKDYNSVDMSMGQFANFYMPPYQAAVEAGAATVMSAFNDFQSIPCTSNRFLLTELLRERWGFKGIVVSDYNSVEELINHRVAENRKDAAAQAFQAGLDIEMVSQCYLRHLKELVQEGKVKEEVIDQAVGRILEKKYELGLFHDPYRFCNEARSNRTINSSRIRNSSLRMAERSVVLLKNERQTLPFSDMIRTVALIGSLGKSQFDMAGAWAGSVDRSKIVTLYDALIQRGIKVIYQEGYDIRSGKISSLSASLQAAQQADAVIVCLGERAEQSGESKSKANLNLPEGQQLLVEELAKTGKPIVSLLMCGRPLIFNEVRRHSPAILCTWWLGSEAGNAICNVLWGKYNPSGKLPMTFPANMGQVPIFYQYKSTGRPTRPHVHYCTSYIDSSTEPAYPFGFGLSFTSFRYGKPEIIPSDHPDHAHAFLRINISNTGSRDGEEVVQLYVQDKVARITRPVKELKGFQKVFLKAGESKTVTFPITDETLGYYDNDMHFTVEKGEFIFMTGGSSHDTQEVTYFHPFSKI